MYLRGTGWSPTSTQICQSVSRLRKARCSHSTPSITPWPMCLASSTPGHQFLVGLRQQEIGAGKLNRSLGPKPVDDLVKRAGSRNLGIPVAAPVVHGHGGAVRHKLDVGVAAGPADAELVRAAHDDIARGAELDLLDGRS